jgi:hypothetical protein
VSRTIIPLQFELVVKPTRESLNEELLLKNNDHEEQLVSKITITPHDDLNLQYNLLLQESRVILTLFCIHIMCLLSVTDVTLFNRT